MRAVSDLWSKFKHAVLYNIHKCFELAEVREGSGPQPGVALSIRVALNPYL